MSTSWLSVTEIIRQVEVFYTFYSQTLHSDIKVPRKEMLQKRPDFDAKLGSIFIRKRKMDLYVLTWIKTPWHC